MLQRAVRNSVFSALGTFATLIINFAFAGLTIRFLGEARGGYMIALQALLGISVLLGGALLSTPAIRRVADLKSQGAEPLMRSVIGSVLTMNLLTSILFSSLILAAFPVMFSWSRLDLQYRSDALVATVLICVSFSLTQIDLVWQATYQALERYDLLSLLSIVFGLVFGILGIMALRSFPTMSTVAGTMAFVGAIRLLCDLIIVSRIAGRLPMPSWNWLEIRPMLSFGGWTYLNSVGGMLFNQIDRLLVTAVLGSAVLPYYAIPQRVFSQVHTALVEQSRFLFPMFSSLGGEAQTQIGRLEDRLRWYMAVLSGVAYTAVALLGPIVLGFLIGNEFSRIAFWALMAASLQGFVQAQMIVPYFNSWAVGYAPANTIAQLALGTLVIGTALILVPKIGFIGASIAQLWNIPVVFLHSVWIRRKLSKGQPALGWLWAYVSPGLMILTWFSVTLVLAHGDTGLSLEYIVSVIVGGLAGIAVLWLTETHIFPSRERWQTLRRAFAIPIAQVKTWATMR